MDLSMADSFETLTREEWDKYLEVTFFDDLLIDDKKFALAESPLKVLSSPRLHEIIRQHNDRVYDVKITYCLCRHYFDKGIPDKPWYKSPGDNGESIQYFPEFKEEHWMRQYWFRYFADVFYLKVCSVWDSIIELLNEYYEIGGQPNLGLRDKVCTWLKKNKKNIFDLLDSIFKNNAIYEAARNYRNAAAHGTSASLVKNTIVETKQSEEKVFPDLTDDGKLVYKKFKVKKTISVGPGEYTYAETIMSNMEEYAKMSGVKIQELISLLNTCNSDKGIDQMD